jgi:hypothetical protein
MSRIPFWVDMVVVEDANISAVANGIMHTKIKQTTLAVAMIDGYCYY